MTDLPCPRQAQHGSGGEDRRSWRGLWLVPTVQTLGVAVVLGAALRKAARRSKGVQAVLGRVRTRFDTGAQDPQQLRCCAWQAC